MKTNIKVIFFLYEYWRGILKANNTSISGLFFLS